MGGASDIGNNFDDNSENITGTNSSYIINNDGATDLTISGTGNSIHIETNLSSLRLTGTNNELFFSAGVSVQDCTVTGIGNNATQESNVSLSCRITGASNTGF